MVRYFLVMAGLCWLSVLSAQSRKSVFFVGNSFCFVNDFADVVEGISTSMGDTLDWVNFYKGAAGLEKFWEMPACIQRLDSLPYDVIFLQEFHLTSAYPEAYFDVLSIPYADSFLNHIAEINPCAETYITMTWAREEGNVEDCASDIAQCTYEGLLSRTVSNFQKLRAETGTLVSPVGLVWDRVMELYPWIDLYAAHDRMHPSVVGTYLYACVQYSLAFKKSPVGAWVQPTVPQEIGEILQQATWDILLELEPDWGYHVQPYNGSPLAPTQSVNGDFKFRNMASGFDSFWWEIDGEPLADPKMTFKYTSPDNCRHDIGLVLTYGCDTISYHYTAVPPNAHNIVPTVVETSCTQSADGSIGIDITKEVAPVSFSWSDGSTELNRSGLSAGTYTLTVTNGDGCIVTRTVVVGSEHESTLGIVTMADCAAGQTGKAIVTCQNCAEPVSWHWSDGQQTATADGLSGGSYTVTATEANGCQLVGEAAIDTGSACGSVGEFDILDITDTSYTLRWNAQPCAESYLVMWKELNGTTVWEAAVPGHLLEYTVSGLLAGHEYRTRIKSVCYTGAANTSWHAVQTDFRIFYDYDRDGFGDDSKSYEVDVIKSNYALVGGDCLDSDSTAYPGAPEYCDLVDNDCNGIVDEGTPNCYMPLPPVPTKVCEQGIELVWPEYACATGYELRVKSLLTGDVTDYSFPAATTTYFYEDGALGDTMAIRLRIMCSDSASAWSLWRNVEITNHPYIVSSNVDTLGFVITTPSTAPCHTMLSNVVDSAFSDGTSASTLATFADVGIWSYEGRYIGTFAGNVILAKYENLPAGAYIFRGKTPDGEVRWCRLMKI